MLKVLKDPSLPVGKIMVCKIIMLPANNHGKLLSFLFSVGQPPCAPINTNGKLIKLKHGVSKSLVDSSTQTLRAA